MIYFSGNDGLMLLPGNAQAIGSRNEQQDSFGYSDPWNDEFAAHGGLLAVLADGMGGMACGADASQIAVRTFLDRYGEKRPEQTVAAALANAIEAADRAVFDFAAGAGREGHVGSTLVAAVFCEGSVEWVSAGDSALYLRRRSTLTRLTHPHTLAARLAARAARGELSPEAAREDPDREALTSYVGGGGIPEIDASEAPLSLVERDCVLLCSDGLYRALEEREMGAALDEAESGQEASDLLVARALHKNLQNQDNVTALCVKVAGANSKTRKAQ